MGAQGRKRAGEGGRDRDCDAKERRGEDTPGDAKGKSRDLWGGPRIWGQIGWDNWVKVEET